MCRDRRRAPGRDTRAAWLEPERHLDVPGATHHGEARVLGTGRAFELEVFESPGGYICGEQSALIEAIEEHRAEPRNRPPAIGSLAMAKKSPPRGGGNAPLPRRPILTRVLRQGYEHL